MGEPVRIMDLARELIELSGLVPDEDIKIVETGLRPGEKLHEELVADGEDVQPTVVPKIKVHRTPPRKVDSVDNEVDALIQTAQQRNEEATRDMLWRFIESHDKPT